MRNQHYMDNAAEIIAVTPESLQRFAAATASDHHSRAAYVGRIQQTERVTIWDENGQPFEKEVSFLISWDSISKILELVRKRALY